MATFSVNSRNEKAATFTTFNVVAGTNKYTAPAKKYDEKYEKQAEASFAGVFLFAIPVLFTVFSYLNLVQYEAMSTFVQVMVIGGLVLRVIATKWVSSIATEQNRDAKKWMALSFFLPATSLIIMGQTKKLNKVAVAQQKAGYAYDAQSVFQRVTEKEKLQMAS